MNKELANENLEHKPKLKSLQNELLTAQSEVKTLLSTYKDCYNELSEYCMLPWTWMCAIIIKYS